MTPGSDFYNNNSNTNGGWYKFYDSKATERAQIILAGMASPEKKPVINIGGGTYMTSSVSPTLNTQGCPNGVCKIGTSELSSRGSTTPF